MGEPDAKPEVRGTGKRKATEFSAKVKTEPTTKGMPAAKVPPDNAVPANVKVRADTSHLSLHMLIGFQCENCRDNSKKPECLMIPGDVKCWKCRVEKRRCAFPTKGAPVPAKTDEEEFTGSKPKRAKRTIVKKESGVDDNAGAGPSGEPVAIRRGKSISLRLTCVC
jgi:hypothetical protein